MDQFAYLKRHSALTNLHRVINDLLENINESAIMGTRVHDIIERLG